MNPKRLIAAGIGAGVLLVSGSAVAVPIDEYNRAIQNAGSHNCIGDSGEGLRASPCDGSVDQKWQMGDGISFANIGTGNCLDDSQEGVRAFPCNGSAFQQWSVERRNDGTENVILRNRQTGRCLDENGPGGRPYSYECNPTAAESFTLVP